MTRQDEDMDEPEFTVTKPGIHHVVTGRTPHHEDDCTPACDMWPHACDDETYTAVEFATRQAWGVSGG